jgi:hypothetical protein
MATPEDNGVEPLLRPLRLEIARLKAVPFMSGEAHEVTFVVQDAWVKVPHRLGRRWVGWIETGLMTDTGTGGWLCARRSANDDLFIELRISSYPVLPTFLFWIF